MALIQVILVIFFLTAVYKVFLRFKKIEINLIDLFVWDIFWALGIVFVIWPNLSAKFAKFLGVGRGVDLIVYLSIAIIFFIIFKIVVKIEKINREITLLVRKDALKK